ncbi:MAG: hypothetical protein ACI9MS_002845, partial [Glaciecola sp.]
MNSAALIQPQTHQQTESLYQVFLNLNGSEKMLLMILAVVYKPIGIAKLEQIVDILCSRGLLPKAKKEQRLSLQQKEKLIGQSLLIVNNDGVQLNRLLANRLTSEIGLLNTLFECTAHEKLVEIIMAAEQVEPAFNSNSLLKKEVDKYRVIRDLYYLDEIEQLKNALAFNKNPQIIDHHQNSILVEILFLPFNLDSFLKLPDILQYQAFATLIRMFQINGQNCEYPIQLLERVCDTHTRRKQPASNAKSSTLCHYLLAEQYLYQMRFEEFDGLQVTHDESSYGIQLRAAYYFLTGDNQQAINYFEKAIRAKNKVTKRKNQYLSDVLGYFYKLALMVQANKHDVSYFSTALQQVEFEESDRKVNSDFYNVGRSVVKSILSLSTGEKYNIRVEYSCADEEIDFYGHQLGYFNYLLSQVWCNKSKDPALAKLALKYQHKFNQLGYPLFAQLCQQLEASFNNKKPLIKSRLVDITALIETKSQWDLALDKLIALNPNIETTVVSSPERLAKPVRLIWELVQDYDDNLTAREQKLNKNAWSKGRVVSLKRLKEEIHLFDYLSDSDKRICRAITAHQSWGYYPKREYTLQGLSALDAAVGIDNLYKSDDLSFPIELTKREPELLVSQQGDQLCLSIADLSGDIDDDHDDDKAHSAYRLKLISDDHYQLTVFSPEHIKVAKIIGEGGLLIPISAKQKALDGISAVAPFLNIQSDISELDTGLETHECDPNLVINIQPTQGGLAFSCVVMPFGESGPAFKPGIGNASLTTDIKGKRIATQRDLQREETLLDQLDLACPAFLDMPDNVLLLDDLQIALAVLEQLEGAITNANFNIVLRWPKGKKVSLTKKLESEHLQLSVSKKSEWFDITGDLHVNNEQVIELRKLLELVKSSSGRFIKLDADQILALSEDLRHKLDQINQLTDDGKFHPLASLQIEEATTGMRMKTIHAWDQQTQKMHQANTIEPQIPSTFQAQLRDYQLVGFDWASRLAHWGAGACLADDMGLGKTLQALAVLLSRASQGPSLVIAPTSVCFNWHQEAVKFTPTLNIKLFADSTNTEQRTDLLCELRPFDCVIISYGLLQRESDILKTVQWHTIVADEAQALKNPLTKRTKAAMALKGDFKMITTGTPIENDLTELWSLFRFINPGLLGNLKRFGERFSTPIENAKDDKLAARKASQGLKALIQPFILRRMKNQVLTELPPRTDINIQVEMSPKERD